MAMDREPLAHELAELELRASQLQDSNDWADQCEQALLATAIVLHQNMLSEGAHHTSVSDR